MPTLPANQNNQPVSPATSSVPSLPSEASAKEGSSSVPPVIPKRRKILVALLLLILIAVGTALYLYQKPFTGSQQPLTLSSLDEQNQQVIKKLTGYDWSNFPPGFTISSAKPKLAATLLLYSEETAMFWPEVATIKLSTTDIQNLNLAPLPTEPSGENAAKLIDNLIAVEKLYGQKGLIPANDHIKRLETLKKYLAGKKPDEKLKIPEEAAQISSTIKIADNQKDYVAKMLERFNNWLKEYLNSS